MQDAEQPDIPACPQSQKCLVYGVGDVASCHLNTKRIHGILKLNTIFAALDGIYLYADHLHIVFIQNACCLQLGAKIQSGLSVPGSEAVHPGVPSQ